MLITNLSIKNFKALKDLTIPMSKLVCLIGENNSGKSSLLQAVCFSGGRFKQICIMSGRPKILTKTFPPEG